MSGRAINRVLIVPGGAGGTGGNTGTISAGTAAATLGEVVFADSNGVTFGVDGQTVTASVGAAGSVNFSAGTASADLDAVVFSNSNGVSFGLNGSTITATVQTNYLTTAMASNRGSDFVQATAVFNGTNASGTIASNAISVSVGNYLTSQSNQAASASNGSFTFQTLGFSNANNVTFGTSAGSIVTASVAAAGGATYSEYDPYFGALQQFRPIGNGAFFLDALALPNVQFQSILYRMWYSNAANSTGTVTLSVVCGIYTKSNASTINRVASASNSFTAAFAGIASSVAEIHGARFFPLPLTTTLTQGQYYFGFASSTSADGQAAVFSNMVLSQIATVWSGLLGTATSNSNQYIPGRGVWSSAGTAVPSSIAFSDITGGASTTELRPQLFMLLSQTA